jgi:hypothetical protein
MLNNKKNDLQEIVLRRMKVLFMNGFQRTRRVAVNFFIDDGRSWTRDKHHSGLSAEIIQCILFLKMQRLVLRAGGCWTSQSNSIFVAPRRARSIHASRTMYADEEPKVDQPDMSVAAKNMQRFKREVEFRERDAKLLATSESPFPLLVLI